MPCCANFITTMAILVTLLAFLVLWVLFVPFCEHVEHKAIWKNSNGKRIEGDKYKFPFGALFLFNYGGGSFALEQANKYGPIYRLFYGTKPVCVLANMEDVKQHYKDQMVHPRERNLGFGYPFGPLLGESLGAKHGKRWTLISAHFKSLMSAPHVKSTTRDCISEALRWVDLKPWTTDLNFDMTTSVATVSFRFMSRVLFGPLTESEHQELATMGDLHALVFNAIWKDWRSKIPGYSLLPTKINQSLHRFLVVFNEFVQRKITQYKDQDGSLINMGILYTTVTAMRNATMKITMEEFSQTLYEMLFANLDVASAVVTWAVAQTAAHPTAQEVLRAQLQSLGATSNMTFTEDMLEKCEYLNALVVESARLRPILAISFPEQTVNDQEFSGFKIPALTSVAVDFASINRNPNYWSNPNEFQPERFLPSPIHPETPVHDATQRVARIGFGARRCPGSRYGDLMVKSVLAALFLRYRIETLRMDVRSDTVLITPSVDLVFSSL